MTAQIGVLNHSAVALATDSAVTSGDKIYNSANKLFSLSKFHPVGIMVYGSAQLINTHWEIIIKLYRKELGDKKFDSLEEYALDFFKFIERRKIIPNDVQELFYLNVIEQCFRNIISFLEERIEQLLTQKKRITKKEVSNLLKESATAFLQMIRKEDELKILSGNLPSHIQDLLRSDKAKIDAITNKVFQNYLSLTGSKRILAQVVKEALGRNLMFGRSGIVIAGYGDKDIFPCLCSYQIQTVLKDKLTFVEKDNHKGNGGAALIPFAQGEMVGVFMNGIDEELYNLNLSTIHDTLKKYNDLIFSRIPTLTSSAKQQITTETQALFDNYVKALGKHIEKNYSNPVMSILSVLPKEELAEMAEALVNLTTFKRHVSRQKETVGGPIDVAVISKGDGFIWVKRKHYFDPKLNPSFISNYLNL